MSRILLYFSNFRLTSDVWGGKISGNVVTARTVATPPDLSRWLRVNRHERAPKADGILADSSYSPNLNLSHRPSG